MMKEEVKESEMRGRSTSILAEKVMFRIRQEEAWAFPLTMNPHPLLVEKRRWVAFLFIALLFFLAFSFWLGYPASERHSQKTWDSSIDVVVGSGSLQYAESSDHEFKSLPLEKMVAGIGDAFLLQRGSSSSTISPLWIGLILFILQLYFLLTWVSFRMSRSKNGKQS